MRGAYGPINPYPPPRCERRGKPQQALLSHTPRKGHGAAGERGAEAAREDAREVFGRATSHKARAVGVWVRAVEDGRVAAQNRGVGRGSALKGSLHLAPKRGPARGIDQDARGAAVVVHLGEDLPDAPEVTNR